MSRPVICKQKRFDGARCVLNADHVKRDIDARGKAVHGYALRPALSEEIWYAARSARATLSTGALIKLLDAVEKEMKR